MKYFKYILLAVCAVSFIFVNFNVSASSAIDRRTSMIQSVSGKLSGDWYDAMVIWFIAFIMVMLMVLKLSIAMIMWEGILEVLLLRY